jgi:hypothetical protein
VNNAKSVHEEIRAFYDFFSRSLKASMKSEFLILSLHQRNNPVSSEASREPAHIRRSVMLHRPAILYLQRHPDAISARANLGARGFRC